MGGVAHWLDLIDEARANGLDVTAEMFPWTAGSAAISSAVFGRDWRKIFAIDYSDVQWAATGEWLDEKTFQNYRTHEPSGQTIHHYIKEEWNRQSLSRPYVMVASDCMPVFSHQRKVVPNGTATSSRILARYVREEKLLDLNEALARLSLLPAQRLEAFAPAFRQKGRIRLGSDADLTLFDPDTVLDQATYMEPFKPNIGIQHVIVNGVEVVREGRLIAGVAPGRRLLARSLAN